MRPWYYGRRRPDGESAAVRLDVAKTVRENVAGAEHLAGDRHGISFAAKRQSGARSRGAPPASYFIRC